MQKGFSFPQSAHHPSPSWSFQRCPCLSSPVGQRDKVISLRVQAFGSVWILDLSNSCPVNFAGRKRTAGHMALFPREEIWGLGCICQSLSELSRCHANTWENIMGTKPSRSKLTELDYTIIFLRLFCVLIPIKHN